MMNDKESRLIFNVSGSIFETREKTLDFFPETLLGNRHRREQFYCRDTNQYFINRHRHSFEAILFFYQSKGTLYRPEECSLQNFLIECQFYDLPETSIHILKSREKGYLQDKIRSKHVSVKLEDLTFRQKIWYSIENPGSSVYAACFFSIQLSAIFLSVVICVIESYHDNEPVLNDHNVIIEIALSTWFSLEFLLRTLVSPDKVKFFCSVLNWVDLLAIVPNSIIYGLTKSQEMKLFKEARFIRVLRILRLRKVSARTKSVCVIFRDSLTDLFLFFVGLLISVTCGGSIIYYLEAIHTTTMGAADGGGGGGGADGQFTSIPQSMWWAVQTFLTVGYGDVIPKSIAGRLFAAFFMVLGMDTVLLPVLSLIMKFAEFVTKSYDDEKDT